MKLDYSAFLIKFVMLSLFVLNYEKFLAIDLVNGFEEKKLELMSPVKNSYPVIGYGHYVSGPSNPTNCLTLTVETYVAIPFFTL